MTTVEVSPVLDTDDSTADELTHFICCMLVPLVAAGTPTPTLCGTSVETTYEGLADEVDCVVCNHMAWSGYCPNSPDQRCFEYDENEDAE